MARTCLYTSDIAKAVGVHPNTIRLYEEWGFLPPIPRSRSGYRLFTEDHLDQMKLAWMALHSDSWVPSKKILAKAVMDAAQGNLGGALELAYTYLAAVRSEFAHAEAAIEFLNRWAHGQVIDSTRQKMRIGEVSQLLGISRDILRGWERDGLLTVPRDPANGYRLYSAVEIGRLRVLRMLRKAGYSTMAVLRMAQSLDTGQINDLRNVLDTAPPEEDVYSAADTWLTTLKECEQRGQCVIIQLEAMIDKHENRR